MADLVIVFNPGKKGIKIHPYLVKDRDDTGLGQAIIDGRQEIEDSYYCCLSWYIASLQNEIAAALKAPPFGSSVEEVSCMEVRKCFVALRFLNYKNQERLRSFLYQTTFEYHTELPGSVLDVLNWSNVYGAGWVRLCGEPIPPECDKDLFSGLEIQKFTADQIQAQQQQQRKLILKPTLKAIGRFLHKVCQKIDNRILNLAEFNEYSMDIDIFKKKLMLLESHILDSAKALESELQHNKVWSEDVRIFPTDNLISMANMVPTMELYQDITQRKNASELVIVTRDTIDGFLWQKEEPDEKNEH